MSENQEEQYSQYLRDRKRKRNLILSLIGIALIIVSSAAYIVSIALYPKPIFSTSIISPLLPTPTPVSSPTPTPLPSPTPTPVSSPTPTPPHGHTPDPLENNIVAHTPEANLQGVVTRPSSVVTGNAVDITIYLVSRKNLYMVLTVVAQNPVPQETATVSPIPLGTPDVEIMNSYGPGYEVSAIAELDAPEFTVQPSDLETRSLDAQIVKFSWIVLPNKVGLQTVGVRITGLWTKGGVSINNRTIMSTDLFIDVGNGPFVSLGNLTISSVLVDIVGLGLIMPLISASIQKRWEARKGKQKNSSKRPKRSKGKRHR